MKSLGASGMNTEPCVVHHLLGASFQSTLNLALCCLVDFCLLSISSHSLPSLLVVLYSLPSNIKTFTSFSYFLYVFTFLFFLASSTLALS